MKSLDQYEFDSAYGKDEEGLCSALCPFSCLWPSPPFGATHTQTAFHCVAFHCDAFPMFISLCCISLCCISLCTPNIQRTACRCSDLSIVRGHKKVGVELPRPHTHCLFLRLKDVINGFANLNETHIRLLLYAWFVPFL